MHVPDMRRDELGEGRATSNPLTPAETGVAAILSRVIGGVPFQMSLPVL